MTEEAPIGSLTPIAMRKYLENRFPKLSYPAKLLLVNLAGASRNAQRYNAHFREAMATNEVVSGPRPTAWELSRLQELTAHSKFYKPVQSVEDFQSLPIIRRGDLKSSFDHIVREEYKEGCLQTSGTTGATFHYPVSKEFLAYQWAAFWRFRQLHGLSRKDWCAQFLMSPLFPASQERPPFGLRSYTTKQLLLSLYHLNEKNVAWYIRAIGEEGIRWLHAYPSTLQNFVDSILRAGLERQAKALKLKIITTSSEQLTERAKAKIEEIFGCPVRQFYGLVEGVASIYECQHGSLHVDEAFSIVEFVPTKTEGYCNIIGTQLRNRAFPLLRYNSGDIAQVGAPDERCACGATARVVREISGREVDSLVLANKTRVAFFGFKSHINVERAQIEQKEPGFAEMRIVRGPLFSEIDEQEIQLAFEKVFGDQLRFSVEYVDRIDHPPHRKYRYVINHCLD